VRLSGDIFWQNSHRGIRADEQGMAIKALSEDVKCCVYDKIVTTVWVETDAKLYCQRYPIKDYVGAFIALEMSSKLYSGVRRIL
jgi:hypothetical protein